LSLSCSAQLFLARETGVHALSAIHQEHCSFFAKLAGLRRKQEAKKVQVLTRVMFTGSSLIDERRHNNYIRSDYMQISPNFQQVTFSPGDFSVTEQNEG
jgi:hypothetical protein